MRQVSVRQARVQMADLLDAVETGEEILISRRGKVVARLVEVEKTMVPTIAFPSRRELRERQSPARTTAAEVIRADRDERG